jgi:hypothetical protein
MRLVPAYVVVLLGVGVLLAPAPALAATGARHTAESRTTHASAAAVNFRQLGDGTTYAISGHVLDYGGNPVAGAEVDWGWWDNGSYNYGGSNYPSLTDSTGAFYLPAVTSAPVAGNDDLDVSYNPTTPGLEELESWSLDFAANNDATTPTAYGYEMQPGGVNVSIMNAPAPVIEVKVGLMSVGFARSDVDLTAATPVASVLPPGFDDVVAYYPGSLGNCTAQTEWLGDPDNPVSVSAGTTAADTVTLDWNNAQHAHLAGPTCQHSGKPGTTVKMILKSWPAGEQADFEAWYGSGSSDYAALVTSTGTGQTYTVPLKVRTNAPVGTYEIDTYRVDAADSFVGMWDYFQVCTFKTSASAIRRGKAVRLSGKVPGLGYVTIYSTRHEVSGQPASLAAKGWVKVGRYKTKSGKFLTGLLHPRRTTSYVAEYSGSDFPAFTSVVKVRVR